jgi:hypothetical protein
VRRFRLLLAITLGACDEDPVERAQAYESRPEPAPADHELGAETVTPPDDGFVYASGVTVLRAHVPTRFDAPLPVRSEFFASDGSVLGVPSAYVEARLCANDEAMRQRLLDSLARIEASNEVEEGIIHQYTSLLARCSSAAHCKWIVDVAASDRGYWTRTPFSSSAGACDDPRVADLIARRELDPYIALGWINAYLDPSDTVPRELEQSVRAVLDAQRSDDYAEAALALIDYPGKDATALLEELGVAAALSSDVVGYVDDADDTALLTRACEYLADAPQCAKLPGARRMSDQELIVEGTEDHFAHALRDPKRAAKANDLLAACVRDPDQSEQRKHLCFVRLADRDWAHAQKLAAQIQAYEPAFGESLWIVSRFPSRDAMRSELRELGLVTDHVEPTYREAVSIAEEMLRSRRLQMFPLHAGTVPVGHDALLFRLAGMAGPAMNDVVFEELPPLSGADEYSSSPYVLRAYADGKRWSVVADAFGDAYAFVQVIGLLNTVAAERGSDLRWAPLTGDGHHAVIVAPKQGIRDAVQRGYIELASL